jgi:hypothetical protein
MPNSVEAYAMNTYDQLMSAVAAAIEARDEAAYAAAYAALAEYEATQAVLNEEEIPF